MIFLQNYVFIYSVIYFIFMFYPPTHGTTAPSGPGLSHCQGFMITELRQTTLGRIPLDE
jgi:hypothetical protein